MYSSRMISAAFAATAMLAAPAVAAAIDAPPPRPLTSAPIMPNLTPDQISFLRISVIGSLQREAPATLEAELQEVIGRLGELMADLAISPAELVELKVLAASQDDLARVRAELARANQLQNYPVTYELVRGFGKASARVGIEAVGLPMTAETLAQRKR
jgi:hypothetical protein